MRRLGAPAGAALLLAAAGCWTPVLELPPNWEPAQAPLGPPDAPPRRDVRRAWHDRERGVLARELPVLVYPDGRLVRDGVELGWYEDGSPRLEQVWDHDRRVGLWRRWGPDGQLLLEVDRGDGVTPAAMRFWHPDGVLAGEGLGVDGVKEGPWTTWYPNGVVRTEGGYASGLKDGPWVLYDEDGRVEARGVYAAGRRVGAWELAGRPPRDERPDAGDPSADGHR